MWKTYRHRTKRTRLRFVVVEARPYDVGEDLAGVDLRGLPPLSGDMVVRQRDEHAQTWLERGREFAAAWEVMP